jgi:signal transduction histidine kinase
MKASSERAASGSVLGWLRLLRSQRVDATQAGRALEALDRNTQAQARMIDDLLDISSIEAGKLTLQREPVDLGPLMSDWVESLQQEATAKALKLETLAEPIMATVSADPDRLRQVVMNLLANAMKYTPSGGRIQVRMTREDTVRTCFLMSSSVSVRLTGAPLEPTMGWVWAWRSSESLSRCTTAPSQRRAMAPAGGRRSP